MKKLTDEEIENSCPYRKYGTDWKEGAKWYREQMERAAWEDAVGLTHEEKVQEGKSPKHEVPFYEAEQKQEEQQKMKEQAYENVLKRNVVEREISEQQKQAVRDAQNPHLREVALKMARDLNPNTQTQAGLGQYGSTSTPPPINKILADADRIFDWLMSING